MTATPQAGSRKIVAGVLGILLGSLGIHKFYLGIKQPAIIMLAVTLVSYALFWLVVPMFAAWAIGIIGLVEGIIYLTKSDEDFHQTYEVGKKPWF